jgi:outer membrane receptor for ferrienterochelin and colicins
VRCKNITNNITKYTVSSLNGNFSCPFNELTEITISYSGYKSIVDTLKTKTDTFLLKPDIFNLSQIVVTATKTNKKLKDTPVITKVINSKQIENMGISNVNEALSLEIPGLDFQEVGYGTDINLQGLGAKNILILIDGELLAGENGNNIDYSRLNTNNIERIEIIKGASSALYGSQAMGGVINIITKKTSKKIELNIGYKQKTNNQTNYPDIDDDDINYIYKSKLDLNNINLFSSIGFNLNKINGQTNFNANSFDAYQLKDKHDQVFNIIGTDTSITQKALTSNIDGYNDFTLSQKIRIVPTKKLSISINGSYYLHNKYDFYMDNKYQQYRDLNFHAKAIYNFSNHTNIKISLNNDNYNKYYFYEKLNSKELNYTNRFINPKVIFNTKLFNTHNIIIGGVYLDEYLLSDKFGKDTLQNKSVNTSTLFIQDDFNIYKKTNIVVGVRSDYHSTFGLNISPKISLMYKYNRHRFRLNYATGFRSPTLKELYMNWDLMGMFTIKGNENLKPETNQYLSISAEYSKSKINGSINIYKNWFKNKIEGEWYNNQTIYKYVNLGALTLSGIELTLKYNIIKNVNIYGGYSFVNDERTFENQMSTVSPHTGTARIEYLFNKPKYKLNINLTGKITGSKDFRAYYGDIIYNGNTIEAWYDVHYNPYSIWNLSVSQVFKNCINIIIGVDNIFNYTADIINFNTSINPGRRFFISARININNYNIKDFTNK